MTKLNIALIEWGGNRKIKDIMMEGHYPTVGEYVIDDVKIADDWKDKMYIVRAVTHFHENLVAVHVEKFNPDAENEKWEKVSTYIKDLKERLDNGSEKSKEN